MEKNQENLWEFLRDFSSDKMSLVREATERTERETSWTLCIQRFNGRKKIPREEAVLQQSPCLWEAASSEPPHSSSATGTPLLWQSWPQRATPPGGAPGIPWAADTEGQGLQPSLHPASLPSTAWPEATEVKWHFLYPSCSRNHICAQFSFCAPCITMDM